LGQDKEDDEASEEEEAAVALMARSESDTDDNSIPTQGKGTWSYQSKT